MGIVGCYDMHLYCDNTLPSSAKPVGGKSHGFNEFPWQGSGTCQTYSECKKEAQKAGWSFKRDGSVICPRCSRVQTRQAAGGGQK
ncbi:hypothetical protein NFI95_05850 [Acetobacteraceae bacterium KSS8]|uniref:Uncharacterized protein n=1 Tax=Endosaccharibacter trunci TaxID=2812733 RepID=A0ABT1W805_9PROT|nr:hypothetical protein [Acetobacteraceae bacterium KSS8]